MKKNKGITLIALIVTIIILLILSGIAIATLGGENGLFARVKLGKERYAISEAKEKLELEIANLQIEQQGKGEELKKEDLPKMNNNEIDVRDTTNFPVEVIYKNYKFEVDSNFHVTYVGEANETIITYTTEPDGYTNQNKVKVLVKISNPKGIKSILKPGETDKILPQDRTTAGIEFTVTKNGHYELKVEDVDGNEVSKDIYIELIDTLAPGEFTPEIQKADSSITVIENGKDAEATEKSCKSGIDHYEYYLIDSSNKETKYDTNKIENLELGSYKLYVIAYDRARNSRKSNTIDFKITRQYKQVSTGYPHTLAIDTKGKIWAGGYNGRGGLGDETTISKYGDPVQILKDKNFKQVQNGYDYSLALDEEGNLWTWGSNQLRTLGDGRKYENEWQRNYPLQITKDIKFVDISAGIDHCFAIDETGNIWGWGENNYGCFGDNGAITTTEILIPTKLNFSQKFKQVISGCSYSLALDMEGYLWGWGENTYGQLGDETTSYSKEPVQICKETKFTQIVASKSSERFYFAIDVEGNLWSCGQNKYGQLGNGTTNNSTLSKVKIDRKFKQISAGTYNGAAIDVDGNLWTWGSSDYDQLGYASKENALIPKQITTGTKYEYVSMGDNQGYVIDVNGNMSYWGIYDGNIHIKTERLVPNVK